MVSVKLGEKFPESYYNAALILVNEIDRYFYPVTYAVWSQPEIDKLTEWKLTIAFDKNIKSPGKLPIAYVKDVIGYLDNMPLGLINDIILKVGSDWDTDPNCEAGIEVKLPPGVIVEELISEHGDFMNKKYNHYIQMLGGASTQLTGLLNEENIDIEKVLSVCVISEDVIGNLKRDMLDILSKRNEN